MQQEPEGSSPHEPGNPADKSSKATSNQPKPQVPMVVMELVFGGQNRSHAVKGKRQHDETEQKQPATYLHQFRVCSFKSFKFHRYFLPLSENKFVDIYTTQLTFYKAYPQVYLLGPTKKACSKLHATRGRGYDTDAIRSFATMRNATHLIEWPKLLLTVPEVDALWVYDKPYMVPMWIVKALGSSIVPKTEGTFLEYLTTFFPNPSKQ